MAPSRAWDATVCARKAGSGTPAGWRDRQADSVRTSQAQAHLHYERIGSSEHIGCSESEQPKSSTDEAILAPIVINQPITVVAAVVLDGKALKTIQQVWTAQKPALIVIDGNLDLRPRKSGEHKLHP